MAEENMGGNIGQPTPGIKWGRIGLAALLVVVSGGVFGAISYSFGKEKGKTEQLASTTATATATTKTSSTATTATSTASASTTSAATDETAGWKTYTNTKHGYSIKYPSQWESLSAEDGKKAGDPAPTDEALILGAGTSDITNKVNVEIDIAVTQGEKNVFNDITEKNQTTDTTVGVDKVAAKKSVSSDGTFYLIDHDSKIYKFFEAKNGTNLSKILSTLQFTE